MHPQEPSGDTVKLMIKLAVQTEVMLLLLVEGVRESQTSESPPKHTAVKHKAYVFPNQTT